METTHTVGPVRSCFRSLPRAPGQSYRSLNAAPLIHFGENVLPIEHLVIHELTEAVDLIVVLAMRKCLQLVLKFT